MILELQVLYISQQIVDLIGRDLDAEIFGCDIFNLMSFIQNYRRVIRQDRAVSAIAQSKVGKEKVMIHDHDIGIDSALPHAGQETGLEVRALLAEASVRARIDVPPEGKIFRKVRKFRPVARFGFRYPPKNFINLIALS